LANRLPELVERTVFRAHQQFGIRRGEFFMLSGKRGHWNLGILAAKLGRTAYHLLRTKTVFDERRFFAS
jgi:hypothetical protein